MDLSWSELKKEITLAVENEVRGEVLGKSGNDVVCLVELSDLIIFIKLVESIKSLFIREFERYLHIP